MIALIKEEGGETLGEIEFSRGKRLPKRSKEEMEWAENVAEHIGELASISKSMLVIGESGDDDSREIYLFHREIDTAESLGVDRDNRRVRKAADLSKAVSLAYTIMSKLSEDFEVPMDELLDKMIASKNIMDKICNDINIEEALNYTEEKDKKTRGKVIRKVLEELGYLD